MTFKQYVLEGKELSDWVLYLKFDTTGSFDKGVYALVPYKNITPHMEAIIKKGKMEEKTKDYKLYVYAKSPAAHYLVRVGTREGLAQTLVWYKGMYGSNLKSLPPKLKPETEKHFGAILNSLD